MRLPLGAILVAGLSAALAGCPEHNVDATQYPDAWWIPGADAGRADGSPPGLDAGTADAAQAVSDAATWEPVPPPTGVTSFKLNAIAANGSEMVAVGDNGLAFVWDSAGSQWTSKTTPVAANLNAVASASPTSWWIAGDAKTVLHWDGVAFSEHALPGIETPNLKAIAVTSTHVWAVGTYGARYHYDLATTTWTQQLPPFGDGGAQPDLAGLWSSGATAWAVDTDRTIHRISGTSWTEFRDLATASLRAVWGTADTDLWIAGDNTMLHCASPSASTLTCDSLNSGDVPSGTWRAVWGNGQGEVWIGSTEHGLLEWSGSAWRRPVGFDLSGKEVLGLGGSAPLGAWAVGDNVLQRLLP